MSLRLLRLIGVSILVALLAGIAIFTGTRRVKAHDPLADLNKLELDCILVSGTGTCQGEPIGRATIADAAVGGDAYAGDGNSATLRGEFSLETLTTRDGSTLEIATDGFTVVSSSGPARNIRGTGYQITGGTGKFAGAEGAGQLTVACNASCLVHIQGNITGDYQH